MKFTIEGLDPDLKVLEGNVTRSCGKNGVRLTLILYMAHPGGANMSGSNLDMKMCVDLGKILLRHYLKPYYASTGCVINVLLGLIHNDRGEFKLGNDCVKSTGILLAFSKPTRQDYRPAKEGGRWCF